MSRKISLTWQLRFAWVALGVFVAVGGLNFARYLVPGIRRTAAQPVTAAQLDVLETTREADCIRPLLPEGELAYWRAPGNPFAGDTAVDLERFYFLQSALAPRVLSSQSVGADVLLFYSEGTDNEPDLKELGWQVAGRCEGVILARRLP